MFIKNNFQFLRLWHDICAPPIGHLLNCQTGGWSWLKSQKQLNSNKPIETRLFLNGSRKNIPKERALLQVSYLHLPGLDLSGRVGLILDGRIWV